MHGRLINLMSSIRGADTSLILLILTTLSFIPHFSYFYIHKMKIKFWLFCGGIILTLVCSSWGFFAHKTINRLAVFTLPEPIIGFYKQNIDFITEQATAPDKRRYSDPNEAPRHYIDLDHYELTLPLDTMPLFWKEAVEKFTEDTLKAYGIVPWIVNWKIRELTQAFKEVNKERILRLSADIGHYISDAHVPLHTSENYDGQMTNQKGIHGFWESRLPELFYTDYDFFVGTAEYLDSPFYNVWKAVKESFNARDSVLGFERELNIKFPEDKKYALVAKGATMIKTYSEEYSKAYHQMLNNMVERRFCASIKMVGSIWYTCWVNAGQPSLQGMSDTPLTDEQQKKLSAEEEQYKNGKIIGRPEN